MQATHPDQGLRSDCWFSPLETYRRDLQESGRRDLDWLPTIIVKTNILWQGLVLRREPRSFMF